VAAMDHSGSGIGRVYWNKGDYIRVWDEELSKSRFKGFGFNLVTGDVGRFQLPAKYLTRLKLD